MPAPGFEDLTTSLPFFFGLVTLPSMQCAALSADFACPSVFPASFGTTQVSDGGDGGEIGGGVGFLSKVAVTVVAALTTTVQLLVPAQPPPDQPLNSESAAAVAARATTVPS